MSGRAPERVPLRTCVACRRVRSKAELVRIVRTPDGGVAVDSAGSAPGRGAYVCPEQRCTRAALKRLAGALRVKRIDFNEVGRSLTDVGVT